AKRIGLNSLVHWDQAPANASVLRKAGVSIALTSNGLDKPESLPTAVRQAIAAGLSFDEAMEALTSTPARLLGVDSLMGSIAPGKLANLIIASDSLFKEGSEIRSMWLQGQHYPFKPYEGTARWASGKIQGHRRTAHRPSPLDPFQIQRREIHRAHLCPACQR
ncbi:MAG: amidohydrolase family protein, partial [Bacteroidota bacterium]